MPQGLKAAWMRLTGGMERLVQRLADEAAHCDTRDRRETQAMIDRHLDERRALDAERDQARTFADLLADLEAQSRPGRAIDPRQSLKLPPDEAPLDPVDILDRPDLILERLSYRTASFTRDDILRALTAVLPDPFAVKEALDRVLASPDLVRLSSDTAPRFTTLDYQENAAALHLACKTMSDRHGHTVSTRAVQHAIDRQNTELQRRAGRGMSGTGAHRSARQPLCASPGSFG